MSDDRVIRFLLAGFSILFVLIAVAPSSAFASCGGANERACCLFEEGRGLTGPACDSGLTEVFNCGLGISCGSCAISVCLDITDCGGDGQRACCLAERFPSCDEGLAEDFTTAGVCDQVLSPSQCICNPAIFGSSLTVCRPRAKIGENCLPVLTPCAEGLDCRPVFSDESAFRCFPPSDDASFLTVPVCQAMYVPGFHQRALDNDRTVSFGTGFSGAAIATAGAEIGVVYGRDGCFGCYQSLCKGATTDLSVEAYVAVGHFDVNLQCSSDMVCSNDVNTECSTDADCTLGATCGTVKVCANERGQRCSQDTDCPTTNLCFQGGGICIGSPTLTPCSSSSECGLGICTASFGQECLNDSSVCTSDSDCLTSGVAAGVCESCNSFDGQACVTEVGVSTPIGEVGIGAALTFANCDDSGALGACFPSPDLAGTCDAVGGAGIISIGLGVSPIGLGLTDCDTVLLANVGCLNSAGGFDFTQNTPPICDAGGPYTVECTGSSMALSLMSDSFDQNGDALTYSWSTDCAGGSINSTSAEDPTLTINSASAPFCSSSCTVSLTVTDPSGGSSACSTGVNIGDTTAPAISPDASGKTVECDGSGNASELTNWLSSQAGASASDSCSSLSWSNDHAGLSDGCGATGSSTVTFTATDGCGLSSNTTPATFSVEDTTKTVISSNAPATIIPPDAPVSFKATASDLCCSEGGTVVVEGYDCYKMTKKGQRIDKTGSCVVELNGDTISILDSGGVSDVIEWTVKATDCCGNTTTETYAVSVVNPSH